MARLLLIGNSRWHWAETSGNGLRCWHTAPSEGLDPAQQQGLQAWAAVGPLPEPAPNPLVRRIGLGDIPLKDRPAWLGIDRALVGWRASQQQGHGVLVADAGTALSLTWVDAQSRFQGGLISAGVALQLRGLGGSTAQLPLLLPAGAGPGVAWPRQTAAAMEEGCRRAVAGAILQAWKTLRAQVGSVDLALWLTGGDGPQLMPLLEEQQVRPVLAPDLALEALASLPVVGLLR